MKIALIAATVACATVAWPALGSQPPVPGPPGVVGPVAAVNGLTGDEQARFYHLAEGSEVYPLSWMRALNDSVTKRPFLEGVERFGLIPDAQGPLNPDGMPIGLTAAVTRDLRFPGVKMVGVNCAACHVTELTRNGQKVVRIDGAPNMFDLSRFFGALAKSTVATFTDLPELWAFLGRLRQAEQAPGAATPADLTAVLARDYPRFESMRAATAAEKAFADQLQELQWQELARPVVPLGDGLVVAGPSGPSPAARLAPLRGDVFESQAREVLRPAAGAAVSMERFGPEPARNENVKKALADFVSTLRLLRARAQFLVSLATAKDLASTPPGLGRVDAFGGARNLLFPADARPLTAPICYPHLWEIGRTSWFHWDGSTTSLVERNVGQALGLGAVFDRASFVSTVDIANIHELERLATKITPPVWPAAALGAPDPVRAQRGAALFAARCAQCHADPPAGQKPDRRYPLDVIGTDPARALNFALPVGATPFDEAISPVLKNVIRAAGGVPTAQSEWRLTREYAGRPLSAAWATAPYLHNGSVPTVDDLLRPAAERPRTFPVCGREYDPVKLGLASTGGEVTCQFDTTLTGNGNGGHSGPAFGTDLSAPQRADLIEFLKGH